MDGRTSELSGLSTEAIAPREESVRKIKERKETDLKGNYRRNMAAIFGVYCARQLAKWGEVFPIIGTLSMKSAQARTIVKLFQVEESFKKKTAVFRQYFDETVFAQIVHGSGDLGEKIELKSPNLLASEIGQDTKAATKASGDLDVEIGNIDYVFGNSAKLPSRSLGGMVYEISSRDGYAVPIDLADIRSVHEQLPEGVTWERELLDHYSGNMYTIEDFKTIFSAYCATFFDDPDRALRFYHKYYHFAQQAACWTNDMSIEYGVDDVDREAMRGMKNLYVAKNIIPPICPEFQFKSRVTATRREDFWRTQS